MCSQVDFRDVLSSGGLNTLTFSDPVAKVRCTSAAAIQFGRTLYFDLDTMFAAYVGAGLIEPGSTIRADILLPSKGRFMELLKAGLEMASCQKYSLVVFDSLNGFYNLYDVSSGGTGRASHLLSIVVMMLVRLGIDFGIPVLATSMLRFRKERGWIRSPGARRLINRSSMTVLNARRLAKEPEAAGEPVQEEVQVEIERHPSIPQGTIYPCDGVSITLR